MKQETYAEHQYRRCYSLLREAYSSENGSYQRAEAYEEIDRSIEDCYYFAANRSIMSSRKREKVGMVFWMDKYQLIRWHQENLPLARKINKHVNKRFLGT